MVHHRVSIAVACVCLASHLATAAADDLYDLRGPGPKAGISNRVSVEVGGKAMVSTYRLKDEVRYRLTFDNERKVEAVYTFEQVEGPVITRMRVRMINDESTYTEHRGDQDRILHRVDPLVGRVVITERAKSGWTSRLVEGEPTEEQAASLARVPPPDEDNWFPKEKVRIGATWKIPSVYVARGYAAEKDLAATGDVISTLIDVQIYNGEQCAVIKTEGKIRGTYSIDDRKATFEVVHHEIEFRSLKRHRMLKIDSRGVLTLRQAQDVGGETLDVTTEGTFTTKYRVEPLN